MGASQKDAFLEQIRHLVSTQRVGVLATQYHSTPHQSLIAYVGSDDLSEIYFATPVYTRKVAAMEQQPQVALMIDSRQNVESDFDSCIAVTAHGGARKLEDARLNEVRTRYLERHPYLESFVSSPTCHFYLIAVERYSMASRFQNVDELTL